MSDQRESATRSRRGPLAAAAVLLLLVALLVGVVSPAAAAQLALSEARMTSVSLGERCTPAVTATSEMETEAQTTEVTVAGLGGACGERDLALTLFSTSGAALTSATASLAADADDSVTVTVPAYSPADVAGAAVTIGTWGIPATWAYTPPESAPPTSAPLVSCTVLNDPTGTKTCDVTDVRVDAWGYPQLNTFNFYATVTSPSASADVEWQLTINLAHPDLQVNANLADSNNGVALAPGWSCSALPILELRGQADVSTQYVGGGSTVTVWMQGRAAPSPTSGGSLFNCS